MQGFACSQGRKKKTTNRLALIHTPIDTHNSNVVYTVSITCIDLPYSYQYYYQYYSISQYDLNPFSSLQVNGIKLWKAKSPQKVVLFLFWMTESAEHLLFLFSSGGHNSSDAVSECHKSGGLVETYRQRACTGFHSGH